MRRILLLVAAIIVAILIIIGVVIAAFHASIFPGGDSTAPSTGITDTPSESDQGPAPRNESSTGDNGNSGTTSNGSVTSNGSGSSTATSDNVPSTGPLNPGVVAMITAALAGTGYATVAYIQRRNA